MIRLTGMGERVEPGKGDTLCREGLEHGPRSTIGIVGIPQLDLNEAVKETRHHSRERFLTAREFSTACSYRGPPLIPTEK